MKTAVFSGMMMLSCLAMVESAWQVMEIGEGGKCLYRAGSALYLVTGAGAVLETVDGLDWETVAQLGEAGHSVRVAGAIRSGIGLTVLATLRDREADIARTSLYRTLDGVNWETAIDGAALGVDNVALAEPVRVPGGWLTWTEGNMPAVVWHSTDGFAWDAVYRDDALALVSGLRQSGDAHAISIDSERGGGWLQSADGLDWSRASAQPGSLIRKDGYYIGLNNTPAMAGTIYYSTDGRDWELVLAPAVSSPAKRLIHAAGTLVLTLGYDQVFTSTDGVAWTRAALPTEAIRVLGQPLKVTLGYAEGRFFYQLQAVRPPGFPVPDPDRLGLESVDGLTWTAVEWQDSYADEALGTVPNPLYTNPPAPVGGPGPDLAARAREVQIDGYVLKMEEIPEGRQLGLFLKAGDGEFQVVNSSFGRLDLDYPYTEPADIASIGAAFVALNKSGLLGYFDPAADHLSQPLGLKASTGKYDDRIELTWLPVDGAEAYRIFRTTVGEAAVLEELATIAEPAFADWHNLDSLAVYEYRVQAVAGMRESFLSLPAEGRLWSLLFGTGSAIWGEIVIPGWPTHEDPGGTLPRQKPALSTAERSHYPWLYNSDHQWFYCHERPGNLWLWDTQLGWLWTRHSLYPHLYSMRDKSWLYFIAAGEHVRWFYHYVDAAHVPLAR